MSCAMVVVVGGIDPGFLRETGLELSYKRTFR